MELLRGDTGDALEGGLEVGAGGEAAVFGNGVVVPFRMEGELALGFLNAQMGEPGVEESLTGGLEPGGKEINLENIDDLYSYLEAHYCTYD